MMKSLTPKTATDVISDPTEELIVQSLAKLDKVALGISVGTLFGLIIFFATNYLIFKGGNQIGKNLALLGQYFIGYEVTITGSLIGSFYGFVSGFILGWLSALFRNICIAFYVHLLKLKGSMSAVNDFIDNP